VHEIDISSFQWFLSMSKRSFWIRKNFHLYSYQNWSAYCSLNFEVSISIRLRLRVTWPYLNKVRIKLSISIVLCKLILIEQNWHFYLLSVNGFCLTYVEKVVLNPYGLKSIKTKWCFLQKKTSGAGAGDQDPRRVTRSSYLSTFIPRARILVYIIIDYIIICTIVVYIITLVEQKKILSRV
jgi:hypothetical protein